MSFNTVIVLGASCELGSAIIERLKSKYAIYAVCRDNIELEGVNYIKCKDVQNYESFIGIESYIAPEHNKRIIINCIGNFVRRDELQNFSEDDIGRIIKTNLYSFLFAYKAFIGKMIHIQCGAFVTFGSISNRYNYPHMAIYNAAKEALMSLIISAANEQHQNNIRFIHLNLSTLKVNKEIEHANTGGFEKWLSPSDVANILPHLIEMQSGPINKTIIDLYNYSKDYYQKSYYSREPLKI